MKRIVYELGLKNVIVMIPFCRNLEEAGKVIAAMATHGLTRRSETNRTGLEIYMMCEIPSNVIQIDDFSQLFDGFSIGSNDLTQLTLGCDRDSALVADIFDERNPSVVKMIKMAIEGAKRNHKHIGICGQAPSDFPEVVDMLVEANIDSISVTADSFMKTLVSVNKAEKCFMEQMLVL
jgi:pyruvate,water dikinase